MNMEKTITILSLIIIMSNEVAVRIQARNLRERIQNGEKIPCYNFFRSLRSQEPWMMKEIDTATETI